MGNRYSWTEMGTDRVPFVPAIEPALRVPPEDWDGALAQAAQRVAEIAALASSHV
jgi:hypothetical protein